MKHSKSTAGVIASFNQERYIVEAVESLIHQVDELIVVDDQSTDETLNKLKVLQSEYKNLIVIEPYEKLSVSGAYNLAAQTATSEILIIQGGDDVSMPERVQIQVAALGGRRTTMVYSQPIVINRHSHVLPDSAGPEFIRDVANGDYLSELFFNRNFICAPSVALFRSQYIDLGGFPLNVVCLQDYALWLRVAEVGEILRLERPVVKYRKHGGNLSRQNVIDISRRFRESTEFKFIIQSFVNQASRQSLIKLTKRTRNYSQNESTEMLRILAKSIHPALEVKLTAVVDLIAISQQNEFLQSELIEISDKINSILYQASE